MRRLARDTRERVVESGPVSRTPSSFSPVDTAVAADEWAADQEAPAARDEGADRDIRIVPGV